MSAASDKAFMKLYAAHQDLLERAYATALNQLAANAGKELPRPKNPREAQAYIDKLLRAEEQISAGDPTLMRELYPEIAGWIRPDKRRRGGQGIKERRRSAFDTKVRTAVAIADSMMELLESGAMSKRVQLSTRRLQKLADLYAAEQLGVLYTGSDGKSETEYLARERRNRRRRKTEH